ncbi:hypothetical protein HaLaN_02638 [Haematococcus lacustris]|uniref:Uncharacterized protein n=1 Tax=Haematococcus lacustris TaxID=44745 RepID=A0A699YEL2_HAELA|nr:hypothetical protein HaLaN_02638 [Haematococcus lacustris]
MQLSSLASLARELNCGPPANMLTSKYQPYKRQGGQAARCACCVRSTSTGSTGWVEIVEGAAV